MKFAVAAALLATTVKGEAVACSLEDPSACGEDCCMNYEWKVVPEDWAEQAAVGDQL